MHHPSTPKRKKEFLRRGGGASSTTQKLNPAKVKNAADPAAVDALKHQLQLCEEERDFLYKKLFTLKVFIQEGMQERGGGIHTAFAAHEIQAILFAENDVFKRGSADFPQRLKTASTGPAEEGKKEDAAEA